MIDQMCIEILRHIYTYENGGKKEEEEDELLGHIKVHNT